jgi:predicted RND superfamily exporter protein
VRADGTSLRRLGAVALLVLAPAAAFLARGVSIDNRLERWVGRNHEEDRRYAEFRSAFGSDEFIVVALHGRPLFAADSLREMTRCLERLEAIDGVERVQGVPAVYRDLFGSEDPAELEREMTSTPFYTGLLLSEDRATTALLLEVAPGESAAARRHLVDAVRAAVQPLADTGFRVALVGAPVLIVALDDLSKSEAEQTFPIAVLGSLLVLAALLRSPRAMAAAAASSGIAVLLTLGLVVAVGGSLNMLTAALPSLLWVLGLSYSVHIISRYQRLRAALAPGDALRRALAETRTGCLFSAVTTALGFASLLTATMPPVRELGVFGAAGIMLALASSMTVAPLVVELLRVPARRPRTDAHGSVRLAHLPLRRPRAVLVVASILFALAVASVPRIRLESNPLAFLPSDHPVSLDYGFVGSRVAGFHTAEVVLNLPLPWTDPATWPVVEGVGRSLSASPIVARVVSPLDLLRKLAQWDAGLEAEAYRLPADGAQAEALVGQLDDRGRAVLSSLVTPTGRDVRLSVVVREMDEGLFLGLVREARVTLGRLPPGYSG